MQNKKKMIVLVAALLAVIGIAVAWRAAASSVAASAAPADGGGRPGDGQAADASSEITVKVQTPEVGDIVLTTEYVGKIEEQETVNVYPEISEEVTAVYFNAGDRVNEGDLLFEVDSSSAQLQLELAEVQYELAIANFEKSTGSTEAGNILSAEYAFKTAAQNLADFKDRYEDYEDNTYYPNKSAASEALTEARQALSDARKALSDAENNPTVGVSIAALEAAVEEAEEAYEQALSNYNAAVNDSSYTQYETQKTSYLNAYNKAREELNILNTMTLEENEKIAQLTLKQARLQYEQSIDNIGSGKVYAPISGIVMEKNVSKYDQVSASTIAFVIGDLDTVDVVFSASSGGAGALQIGDAVTVKKGSDTYTATVTEIPVKTDSQSGLFKIRAELSDSGLLSGVTVKVEAATARSEGAVLLPVNYVYYDGAEPYVFLYRDGIVEKAMIETGISNPTMIECLSGVTEDDQLIVTWHPNLADGAEVKLYQAEG